ncbi:MAG: YvcK family protein, partial [Candidatus Sungbacteria bacterium]|nr:YvcK family protein [Candidatus Sungbacteria bacterium]
TALKKYPVSLMAVVSMADDGGSTGVLRDQYGVLPPGDIRKSLVALAEAGPTLRRLFNYRFGSGDFRGHAFGNIFLSALEKITGDFASAVDQASRLLQIRGRVIPVTLDDTRLYAELRDGEIIRGETNIDIPKNELRAPIRKVWLKPEANINPQARKAMAEADLIVIGPGDLYTSLIPNLLVRGVASAMKQSRAKKIFVANLMTKPGETAHLKAADFVPEVERYLGRGIIDFAVFNKERPKLRVLKRYRRAGAEFIDPRGLDLARKKPKYVLADLLDSGKFARHSPREKLARVILKLI